MILMSRSVEETTALSPGLLSASDHDSFSNEKSFALNSFTIDRSCPVLSVARRGPSGDPNAALFCEFAWLHGGVPWEAPVPL